jgi:uncharacterized protein (DUF1330 family)
MMPRFNSYVATWSDTELHEEGRLAGAAGERAGRLLAIGPVRDSPEQDARAAPRHIAVAGFADEAGARAWFDLAAEHLPGTTVLLSALTEPVWWPPGREYERPDWSRQLEDLPDRMAVFVSVWVEVVDLPDFFDYSRSYRWTVEGAGGVVLSAGPFPAVVLKGDDPRPAAFALMGWPADGIARRAWWDGAEYRPYKDQRHRCSRCTIASIGARA